MSQNENSLLIRIRGDAAGGKAAIAETRAAIASLRTNSTREFTGMQTAATSALGSITSSMNGLAGRVPILGSAVTSLSSGLATMSSESVAAGGSLAALGGPIGITIAAIGAMAAGVIVLSRGLFELAVAAADYRGKMFDMAQQTGVSTETLSALEIIAKRTGTSIEGIVAPLGIFQKQLEEAQDPASRAAELFKELGVETENTEDALRQTLSALAKMPEGFQQTSRALELFGRGGRSFLAILKETEGDLDGTIKKFKELGLVVSNEDAKAADEFNDQLAILQFQFRALLGKEVMPAVLTALKGVSDLFANNQKSIRGFAQVLGLLSRTILPAFVARLKEIEFVLIAIERAARVLDRLRGILLPGVTAGVGAVDPFAGAQASAGAVTRTGGTGRGGGRTPRDTFLQDSRELADLAEREAIQRANVDIAENQRALDEQVRSIEDFTAKAIELENALHDAAIVRINADQEALDSALARKLIKQKEYDIQNREIELRNAEAIQANSEAVFKLEQERDKTLADAQLAAKKRELEIAEDADQRMIDRIKDRIDRGVLLESAGEAEIATIIDEGFARRRKVLEEEDTLYGISLERRKDIVNELIRLDGERAGAAEEASRRIIKAQFEEQNRGAEGATRKRKSTDIDPVSSIGQLEDAINRSLTGDTQQAALAGLGAMTEAFSGLAQAVGQAVGAFVLYGSAGTSVRKVTAEILAGIAQQAAVKAIFHLAEGFAALALAFFGVPNAGLSAGAHFKAAAVYGAVAGIATVAGRLTAGDSFSKGGGGGGSGQTAGGTKSDTTTNKPTPIEVDRRQGAQGQPIINELIFRVRGDAVVDSFVQDYDLNGRTRIKILSDG